MNQLTYCHDARGKNVIVISLFNKSGASCTVTLLILIKLQSFSHNGPPTQFECIRNPWLHITFGETRQLHWLVGERGFDWWIPQSKAGHPLISGLVATSPSVLGPDQSVSEWVNVTSIVKCVEWSVGPDRN